MKRTESFPLSLSIFFLRLTTKNQFSPQRHKEHKEQLTMNKRERTQTENQFYPVYQAAPPTFNFPLCSLCLCGESLTHAP
jgi:hypothetical protein